MEVKQNELAVRFEKTKTLLRSSNSIERFAEALGNDRIARAYVGSVLMAVSQNDRLMACTPGSIIYSALRAAGLQLSVDPSLGHAYLVPYKNTCTFITGYKGYINLALRTGRYRIINVAEVYEGQEVVEDQLKGIHTIKGLPSYERGKWVPIGYMLYFELKDGYSKTFYMTVEELKAHGERYSKTWSRSDSLWHTNPKAMYEKTVTRLGLNKHGYFNPTDMLGLAETMEEESLEEAEAIEGEWMEQAEQEQAEKEAELAGKTTDELSAMLGFEDEPDTSKKPAPEKKAPAKKADPVVTPKASMKDYEFAAGFMSKQFNKIYGNLTVPELQSEIMTLTQYEPKNQEEKVQANDRIQAAKQLIKYIEANPI